MQGARCKVQGVRCQVQVARSKVLVNPRTAKVDFHFIQWQLTVQHSVVVVVVRKCAFYCCGSHSQCGSTIGVGAAAVALPVGGAALTCLYNLPATLPFLLCKYYLWLDFLGDGAKLCVFNESCFILVRPTQMICFHRKFSTAKYEKGGSKWSFEVMYRFQGLIKVQEGLQRVKSDIK